MKRGVKSGVNGSVQMVCWIRIPCEEGVFMRGVKTVCGATLS